MALPRHCAVGATITARGFSFFSVFYYDCNGDGSRGKYRKRRYDSPDIFRKPCNHNCSLPFLN
jgi:hypothetical protein